MIWAFYFLAQGGNSRLRFAQAPTWQNWNDALTEHIEQMVSTLTILLVSVLSLFLVWTMLRPGLPHIKSLEDWEAKKHDVDLRVFRILLDPAEEEVSAAGAGSSRIPSYSKESAWRWPCAGWIWSGKMPLC